MEESDSEKCKGQSETKPKDQSKDNKKVRIKSKTAEKKDPPNKSDDKQTETMQDKCDSLPKNWELGRAPRSSADEAAFRFFDR